MYNELRLDQDWSDRRLKDDLLAIAIKYLFALTEGGGGGGGGATGMGAAGTGAGAIGGSKTGGSWISIGAMGD